MEVSLSPLSSLSFFGSIFDNLCKPGANMVTVPYSPAVHHLSGSSAIFLRYDIGPQVFVDSR
jgi:hypothetical protein